MDHNSQIDVTRIYTFFERLSFGKVKTAFVAFGDGWGR